MQPSRCKRPKKRFPGDPGRGRIYYGAAKPERHPALGTADGCAGCRCTAYYFKPQNSHAMARRARADIRKGRMPYISTKVPNSDWRAVARGEYDAWLRRWPVSSAGSTGRSSSRCTTSPRTTATTTPVAGRSDFVAMNNHALEIFDRLRAQGQRLPDPAGLDSTASCRQQPAGVVRARCQGLRRRHLQRLVAAQRQGLAAVHRAASATSSPTPTASRSRSASTAAVPTRGTRAARRAGCATPTRSRIRRNVVAMSYFNSAEGADDGTWELDRERGRVFENKLKARRTA